MTTYTNSTQLSADLLARLLVRHKLPTGKGFCRDRAAMKEAAQHFGIETDGTNGDWWNLTINALDEAVPDWRGYPAPKANREIAKVLVNRSERDAA